LSPLIPTFGGRAGPAGCRAALAVIVLVVLLTAAAAALLVWALGDFWKDLGQ